MKAFTSGWSKASAASKEATPSSIEIVEDKKSSDDRQSLNISHHVSDEVFRKVQEEQRRQRRPGLHRSLTRPLTSSKRILPRAVYQSAKERPIGVSVGLLFASVTPWVAIASAAFTQMGVPCLPLASDMAMGLVGKLGLPLMFGVACGLLALFQVGLLGTNMYLVATNKDLDDLKLVTGMAFLTFTYLAPAAFFYFLLFACLTSWATAPFSTVDWSRLVYEGYLESDATALLLPYQLPDGTDLRAALALAEGPCTSAWASLTANNTFLNYRGDFTTFDLGMSIDQLTPCVYLAASCEASTTWFLRIGSISVMSFWVFSIVYLMFRDLCKKDDD